MTIGTIMKFLQYAALYLAAAATLSAADDLATLQALLREVREIREARYGMQTSWKEEAQRLKLLSTIEKEKLKSLQSDHAEQRAQTDALKATLHNIQDEQESIAAEIGKVDTWMSTAIGSGATDNQRLHILFGARSSAELERIAATALPTADKLGSLMNILQNAAIDGSRSDYRNDVLTVNGAALAADVLRVGGVIEYYVTPDDSQCGYRMAGDGGAWIGLDGEHAAGIRKAIKILSKEMPAEIVSVPVPIP